jgi:hypothetical protein
MRKIIAALQTSVDCFIAGPNGEMDWAMTEDEEAWRVLDETLNMIDTIILGRRMYPEYEQYWLSLLANPSGGTENGNAYARRAGPIKSPISSFPRLWIKLNGKRQGSFGMWKISEK